MSIRFKIAIFTFFCVFICGYSVSQTPATPWHSAKSAPTSGNIQASLFTGKISYSIPLYTLDDPDFPLNISLRYQSDGFRPLQPSGFYGQDWTLEAGGYITRIVQGFPDEQKVEYLQNNGRPKDEFVGMRYTIANSGVLDKDSVFNMLSPVYDGEYGVLCVLDDYGSHWWDADYMPDIFHFNFMGYQGSFIINNNGEPTITGGDYVEIDLSEWSEEHDANYYELSSYEPSQYSRISITTNDGYKYYFGGNSGALEWAPLVKPNASIDQEIPAINKWHLTSIVAPNGRIMSFDYWGSGHFLATDYDWSEPNSPVDSTNIIYSLVRSSILHSITTSDSIGFGVSFYSSVEAHKMFEHPDYQYCYLNRQLDSIVVSCAQRTLKKARLSYMYRCYSPIYGASPNYYWRYLSSVTISGVGSYTLSYNNIDIQPASAPPFMHQFTYPIIHVATDAEYKALVDRFGFWKTTSLQGLLANVSLPTGGNIRFTYGNHQYGKEKAFRKVDAENVELYTRNNSNQDIGGARIEKIETFSDVNTLVETKTYTYQNPESNNSSGIFFNFYVIYPSLYATGGKTITHPYNYGMLDSHIGYSHVQCMTTIGEQTYKTAYIFDTGHNFYTSVNNPTIHRNNNLPTYVDSVELYSGSLTHGDSVIQTGKLLAVEQYEGNTLLKATYFRYNGIANTAANLPSFEGSVLGCVDTIVSLSRYSAHIARKLFIFPGVLQQTVTYEYANGQPMVTSTCYSYDKKFRKKEYLFTDSQGKTHFTRYTYPDDIVTGGASPLGSWVQSHRIHFPVEEVSGYKIGSAEFTTSGTLQLFAYGPYVISVDSMGMGLMGNYPYLYQTRKLALDNPVTDFNPISANGSTVNYDSRYRLTYEYLFDMRNRLLSIKPFGKIETKYTWSGLYPNTKTIGNQTWQYTYLPYVGVSSETDPRGITTYYSYDAVGRLIEEYQMIDNKKQILNVYQYHTKTE